MHIDTMSMDLSILYFMGLSVLRMKSINWSHFRFQEFSHDDIGWL